MDILYFFSILINFQDKKVKRMDARLHYVKEILQGIKVVKLYAWELPVLQRLEDIRTSEMAALLRSMYLRVSCYF